MDCETEAQAHALLRLEGTAMHRLYAAARGGAGKEKGEVGVGPVCVVHMGKEAVVGSTPYR